VNLGLVMACYVRLGQVRSGCDRLVQVMKG
jgi:hypothetical protein